MIPEEKSSSRPWLSTWFIRSLDEVLGSEGFAVGVLGVRREPGVQVSAEHVHQDLGKHNQISLERPQNPAASSPRSQELIPVFDNLGLQRWLNPRFRSSFVPKSPISDLAEKGRGAPKPALPTPKAARKPLPFPHESHWKIWAGHEP